MPDDADADRIPTGNAIWPIIVSIVLVIGSYTGIGYYIDRALDNQNRIIERVEQVEVRAKCARDVDEARDLLEAERNAAFDKGILAVVADDTEALMRAGARLTRADEALLRFGTLADQIEATCPPLPSGFPDNFVPTTNP